MSDDPRDKIIQKFVNSVTGVLTQVFSLERSKAKNDRDDYASIGEWFRGIHKRIEEYTDDMLADLKEHDQQHPSHQFPLPPERKS